MNYLPKLLAVYGSTIAGICVYSLTKTYQDAVTATKKYFDSFPNDRFDIQDHYDTEHNPIEKRQNVLDELYITTLDTDADALLQKKLQMSINEGEKITGLSRYGGFVKEDDSCDKLKERLEILKKNGVKTGLGNYSIYFAAPEWNPTQICEQCKEEWTTNKKVEK